ncbi:MAG TPA: tetratricopeptide repeat protein [Bryobacteraceae bacterium]|nr:tetratricopeptide repeat protein [Bryobacteraceae bacterium]
MLSALSLYLIAGLAFQAAPATPSGAVETANGVPPEAVPAVQTPAPVPITPELRGDVMMARKRYRDALDYYKPGADKSAVLANKAGIAYHQLMDLKNAEKYYKKAIKLNSKYAEAINNLGTVYYAKKSYKRAIKQYKKALKISPDSASILANLGTAYFARKDLQDASECYARALIIDPDVFERRSSEGTLMQDQSVEERAKFHYFLAKAYAKEGATDRALQYIRKSLEEGFKDRDKFIKDPEFAALQDNPEFKQLMALEPKVL